MRYVGLFLFFFFLIFMKLSGWNEVLGMSTRQIDQEFGGHFRVCPYPFSLSPFFFL